MHQNLTSFQLSIESGNIDAIKVLLDAGANPNLGDDDAMLVKVGYLILAISYLILI